MTGLGRGTRRRVLSVLMPGFTGRAVPEHVSRWVEDGLAGVCLFGHNVGSPDDVRRLTGALHQSRDGLVVAADEEGGTVTRLEGAAGSSWPGHAALGALDDAALTRSVARGLGGLARAAGLDLVLAPVVDVNSEPDNPVIGVRSFGADPALVARHGAAFVHGLHEGGVAACAKHFPGHGATRTDSHVDLPRVEATAETWRDRDLPPFAAAVRAGVDAVMTAHVLVPALDPHRPATASPRVLDVLRNELGFRGAVVSDALDMAGASAVIGRGEAAVRALAAGVDLLCLGNPVFPDRYDEVAAVEEVLTAVDRALRDGRLPGERLEEAAERVVALAAASYAGPSGDVPAGQDPDAAGTVGAEVARATLGVTGEVRLRSDALVLVAPGRIGYAAGRRGGHLVTELNRRRPEWPVHAGDAAELAAVAAVAGPYEVLLVVEDGPLPDRRRTVSAVLDHVPHAVVVYAGLRDRADAGTRCIHAHGMSAVAAAAVADLLLGEHR